MKLIALLAASAAAIAAVPSYAQAASEAGDAGELLGTAQQISGGVTSISATLSNLGGSRGDVDDIDLYRFSITNPSLFGVTVSADLSGDNDAQLYLFDEIGQFVGYDDDDGVGFLPQFDVGDFANLSAGTYYLSFNIFGTNAILTDGVLTGWDRNPSPFQVGDYTLNITGAAGGVVPEPATWAMMIGGVGMAGGALRRRRAKVKTTVSFA